MEKGGLEFPLQQHWSCSSPQQAPKIYTPSWLMTNSIYICSFWEYRYSKWRHWSRVHRILCLIEIGLQLVETERWFGIFVSTALANDQSTSTVNLHILMSPLINICPFWEYRHSKWQHWSFVHRILCLIKIGFKLLVGERRFGILVATALITSIRKFYSSWCLHWSIYVHSENIDIVLYNFYLLYIEYFAW